MNNILTKKETRAHRANNHKAIGTALIAATLLSSSSVFANRPAMEDSSSMRPEVVEDVTETRPTPVQETLPQAPSSVDLMMQNQPHQQFTGDVLQLPAEELQAGETLTIQLLDFPRRGMSMDKVKREYGEPLTISDSIGKPPITSWTYNDRVVYFEFATVLHVVAR